MTTNERRNTYEVVVSPSEQSGIEADLEIHFHRGPLAGMKLVGCTIRRSSGGGTYVTFPGRAFGVGEERRYFDYLRPQATEHDAWQEIRGRVKGWLKDTWKAAMAERAAQEQKEDGDV